MSTLLTRRLRKDWVIAIGEETCKALKIEPGEEVVITIGKRQQMKIPVAELAEKLVTEG